MVLYIYTHTYIHTYIHTHIHTQIGVWLTVMLLLIKNKCKKIKNIVLHNAFFK